MSGECHYLVIRSDKKLDAEAVKKAIGDTQYDYVGFVRNEHTNGLCDALDGFLDDLMMEALAPEDDRDLL